MTVTTFADLGVAEPLQRALAVENYISPTAIQARAIPLLLAGNDLLGIAQTGTGKTAAFALPILQRLAAAQDLAPPRGARALVLAPTRELAAQIADGFKAYGRYMGLRHTVVFGGVGQRPQVHALAHGVDILIATPGRLLDLMAQRHVRLDRVATLVLDEADRMLDMGFVRDVRRIVAALPKKRQSLLFSATMPADVARLAAEMLRDPIRVEIARSGTPVEQVDQRVFFVPDQRKRVLLSELLANAEYTRVIVFTRTKRGASRVADHLDRSGVRSESIHGNKSQNARQRALDNFRTGRARVLVATDIAARGIDVTDVSHVINFELPNIPESYVHRIGRTARAGARGIAISLCGPEERAYLRDIEKLTKRPLAVVEDRPIGPRDAARPNAPTARHVPIGRPPANRPGRSRNRPRRGRGRGTGKPHQTGGFVASLG